MGLFSPRKKKGKAVALLDIGSASVGGAYAYLVDGAQPVVYYTARADIELRDGESVTERMLRSLAFVEQLMAAEGAPQLRRETSSGSVAQVLVSVAAPWQEAEIATTHIEEPHPFTFTRRHIESAAGSGALPEDRIASGTSVIATVLNGYEVRNPYGKRASRASVTLLRSTLERDAASRIEASVRRAFHTHAVELTGFAPVSYAVFKALYPHQKDFVVLDISGSGTDAVFVKRGLMAHVASLPQGTHELLSAAANAGRRSHAEDSALLDAGANETFARESAAAEAAWVAALHDAFASFARTEALPHTVFLLADADARDYLKRLLERSPLRTLWLSENPLALIPMQPSHLAPSVKTRGLGDSDLFLAVLALYSASGSQDIVPAAVQVPGPEAP